MLDLKNYIRSIKDFPKPGIMFRDITPLLSHPIAFRESIKRIVERFRDSRITVVAAAEARGFIFAAPVALELNAAFVPVRKPGKLPFDTHAFHYELEYGKDPEMRKLARDIIQAQKKEIAFMKKWQAKHGGKGH